MRHEDTALDEQDVTYIREYILPAIKGCCNGEFWYHEQSEEWYMRYHEGDYRFHVTKLNLAYIYFYIRDFRSKTYPYQLHDLGSLEEHHLWYNLTDHQRQDIREMMTS